MIPYIRSFPELMAITESRENEKTVSQYDKSYSSRVDSGQRKQFLEFINKKEVGLPDLPKKLRRKWIHNKESISRFIDDLDYNNQIQSSYDLSLIERQNKKTQQDVA